MRAVSAASIAAVGATATRSLTTSTALRPPRYASSQCAQSSSTAEVQRLENELRAARHELLDTRLQLSQLLQSPLPRLYDEIIERLQRVDRDAHAEAAALRYTAMALNVSRDNLEVELRRILSIGLTADAVDAAAIEAGARNYVRANIGFRAERVREEPVTVTNTKIITHVYAEDEKPASSL